MSETDTPNALYERGFRRGQEAANAELLDALRDLLRMAKAASFGVTGNQPRIARAEAAIAKITGRVS